MDLFPSRTSLLSFALWICLACSWKPMFIVSINRLAMIPCFLARSSTANASITDRKDSRSSRLAAFTRSMSKSALGILIKIKIKQLFRLCFNLYRVYKRELLHFYFIFFPFELQQFVPVVLVLGMAGGDFGGEAFRDRSEEHTSELQSPDH